MSNPFPSSSNVITAWYHEAEEARRTGHVETAQACLDRILAHDPGHAGALYSHALLALDSNQLEAAQRWVECAIEVQPHPAFYHTLCVIQIKSGAYASAAQTAQRGLAREPDSLALHYVLALALQVQGRHQDAATIYRRLLELKPDHAAALANLGSVVKEMGSLDEAERHLRQAIALAPPYPGARANLAHVLLAVGRYEEAWPYFEDRWVNFLDADGRPASERTQLPLPEWKGGHPHVANCANGPNSASAAQGALASEARLLVLPEQGHGDSLQFVRYLPLALARFSRVGYICPPPLRRLYEESLCARWPGLVMLDDAFPETGDWDWQCSLMSLPMAFGTRLDNIPAATYLYADSRRAGQWGARLAALPNPELPRVGVVWAGGHSGFTDDKARSLMCAQIAPLLALPYVRWISLQKTDDPAKRADAANASRLIDWTDEIADFADTAALIENLDLVISVDTSVAHLAAAMGKPVWLLNRFAGCWRWLRDRDDSPWYPSVRIFTQSQRDNWNDVLERVAAALPIQGKPYRTFVR
ncbi:tetratricopeptide repeat protein [Paraburkholderia sp. RL17-337-BIB-A]|uniref:tetratricopeptide repeat protein n=1 Tax=Paraburkholderia sp. RL17-337-BIB-A TaxID=3031636 RepID=UPI0038BCD76D